MSIWVPLKEGDGVVGHVNADAAPLAYRLGGASVLSLIDVSHAVPFPRIPYVREASVLRETGSKKRD